MKVFIDFENTFLKHSLFWEKFWNYSNQYNLIQAILGIFSDKISQECIENLPYNPSALNILSYEYNKLDNEIVLIVHKQENTEYAEKAISDLYEDFECRFSYAYYDSQIHSKKDFILAHSKDQLFAYIGTSILDWNIYSNATRFNVISNILILPFFLLKTTNSKNHNTYLNGLLGIFFSYIEIVIPLFVYCVAWIKKSGINFLAIKVSVIAKVFFMSFSGLLKSLERMQTERKYLRDGYDVICGDMFILGSGSINIALLYLIVFLIAGFICGYFSILGMLSGIIAGFVYYKSYLLEFWPKNLLTISSVFITQIIIHILYIFNISF